MDYILGSTSGQKEGATRSVLDELDPGYTLQLAAVTSDVAAQPVGVKETLRGARTRAYKARVHCPTAYAIGMENGIREVDGTWEDWAIIVVISPEGMERITESASTPVPLAAVQEAKRRGFATTTVGSVLAEWHGISKNDPHSFLTHGLTNRVKLLTKALANALSSTLNQKEKTMQETLEISIGDVHRALPIMTMKSGARVAYFNIQGDWELTEAAGIELAKFIPEGTEVLIMPQGKADALLHVMGRVSGLPIVIAPKDAEPAEMAFTATRPSSMTTGKPKTFSLRDADVLKLRGKRAMIVDDVVSTGGTLGVINELLALAGALPDAGVMAIYTEGAARKDVLTLGHLPLF